jgi:hypothetical protein
MSGAENRHRWLIRTGRSASESEGSAGVLTQIWGSGVNKLGVAYNHYARTVQIFITIVLMLDVYSPALYSLDENTGAPIQCVH